MALTLIMRVPELSPGRYDRMIVDLDLDANPPVGLILHIASEGVGAINMLELWRTQQAAESFVEGRLQETLRRYGVKQRLAYRLEPLHNLFVPDEDVIRLIGRSSLPMGVRSRVRAS
jgi:hypothetical protein